MSFPRPLLRAARPATALRIYISGSLRQLQQRQTYSSAMASALHKFVTTGTKIIGVGRNYAAHAKELGNAVPTEPLLFMKPISSYLDNGGTIEIPPGSETLDPEVELAVVIGKKARDIPEESAMDYVGGYAVALDMTARDVQAVAKDLHTKMKIGVGHEGPDGLYYLDSPGKATTAALSTSISLLQWHYRLGHPSASKMKYLLPGVEFNKFQCEACQLGKQTRFVFPKTNNISSKAVFDLVHVDV